MTFFFSFDSEKFSRPAPINNSDINITGCRHLNFFFLDTTHFTMQFQQVLVALTAVTAVSAANASNGTNGSKNGTSSKSDSGASQAVSAGIFGAAAAAGVALLL